MQFCCLLVSEGAVVKLPCSLFVVSLPIADLIFPFCFYAIDFLCSDNNDIVFSLDWSLSLLCLWICSLSAVVLSVLHVSASDGQRVSSSLCLNHLNKNRETHGSVKVHLTADFFKFFDVKCNLEIYFKIVFLLEGLKRI